MFSIIIPTLNEEKIIKKTIKQFDSVRDVYNLEFIVSDSNSCDRTVDISKKSADRVVVHKSKLLNCPNILNPQPPSSIESSSGSQVPPVD